MRKAYQLIEEEAAAENNPSGFISKLQKRDAKDTTRRRVDEDMRSGKFRRSKLVPILWDVPTQTLLLQRHRHRAGEAAGDIRARRSA